jgi:hypothetical protein
MEKTAFNFSSEDDGTEPSSNKTPLMCVAQLSSGSE